MIQEKEIEPNTYVHRTEKGHAEEDLTVVSFFILYVGKSFLQQIDGKSAVK